MRILFLLFIILFFISCLNEKNTTTAPTKPSQSVKDIKNTEMILDINVLPNNILDSISDWKPFFKFDNTLRKIKTIAVLKLQSEILENQSRFLIDSISNNLNDKGLLSRLLLLHNECMVLKTMPALEMNDKEKMTLKMNRIIRFYNMVIDKINFIYKKKKFSYQILKNKNMNFLRDTSLISDTLQTNNKTNFLDFEIK